MQLFRFLFRSRLWFPCKKIGAIRKTRKKMSHIPEKTERALMLDTLQATHVGIVVALLFASFKYIAFSEALIIYLVYNVASVVFLPLFMYIRHKSKSKNEE